MVFEGAGRETAGACLVCVDGRATVVGVGVVASAGLFTEGAAFVSGAGGETAGACLVCIDGRATVVGAGVVAGAGLFTEGAAFVSGAGRVATGLVLVSGRETAVPGCVAPPWS